jgi:lipopolysaccharide/colanic/teichoic acid biosynthesis glycosyltransferase
MENPDRVIPDGMNAFERNIKRIGDCLIAAVLLVIFSPLFLICYIAVKREDGDPAIFKQERIGRLGRPFYIYKFRSMRPDAEEMGPALCKGEKDTRLTKTGKFLRESHLDELPQLYNVFVGDMSFVGPRPERQFYVEQIIKRDPRYKYLYQIRPGITSYATLHNGYTDTMEKMLRRLRYDLFYLEHRSWLLDCKILLQTFLWIVGGKRF